MLATLIIWGYIFFLAFVYGFVALELLTRFFCSKADIYKISKPIVFLVGLCVLNTLAAFLSLFINLSWLAQIIVLVPGIAAACWILRKRSIRFSWNLVQESWPVALLLVLVFFSVLENVTHSPSNSDTGIYHAQAIMWMERYPAVPGLGNLQSRFAYDSNWLVLNALFSLFFFKLQSFHVLPGIFVLAALVYMIEGAARLIRGQVSFGNIYKSLLIPLVFYTVRAQFSSPGTDLPADILIWVTFALVLDVLREHGEQAEAGMGEVIAFIFSVYLLTIKLSAAAAALLAIFLFIRLLVKNKLAALRLLVPAAIILAPWFTRNLILSGYWVYPVPAVAFLSPNWDWKIPLDHVIGEQRSILAWARLPRQGTDLVMAMPLKSWMKQWFENLTANRKLLTLAGLVSPVIFAIGAWLTARKKALLGRPGTINKIDLTAVTGRGNAAWSEVKLGTLHLVFGIAYAGFLFWLFEAPDYRFGYGVVILTILLAAVPWIYWIMTPFRSLEKIPVQKILAYGLVALLIVYQGSVLVQSVDRKTLAARLLLPADYGSLPTVPCSIHNLKLQCAEYYDQCWYGPFPCIPPGSADQSVEMRGSSLRDGFRVIPQGPAASTTGG